MHGSIAGKAKLARIEFVSRVRDVHPDILDALRHHNRAETAEAQARLRVLNRALAWMAVDAI